MKRNSFEKPTNSVETRGKFMKERPISDLTKPAKRRNPSHTGLPFSPVGSSKVPSIDERSSVQIPAQENSDGSVSVKSTIRIIVTSDGNKTEQVFVDGKLISPDQQNTD
jgi:hypothetical protein